MNKIILIGRLTKDPQSGSTQTGHKYARFSLAVNRPGTNGGADFFDIVAWDNHAELAEKYLIKGKQVSILGHVSIGGYEKDGVKRKSFDVIVEQIEFVGGRSDSATTSSDELKETSVSEDDMPF